ncbi:DUF3313 domain-containing protein [Bordetella genomosp. 13]|uniref:DUF3313 domain-containing protein n=1 Tax=Bordetella genomosp. 13 TaxID=463040 RepID=A0A1W6ZF64_9BORD|nr:DUF3313 domain-containing protein [Bordetella genomosp. 13]ARP96026.1 hypothetical protein CAL15_17590 [Bordetella genomosp. 13]
MKINSPLRAIFWGISAALLVSACSTAPSPQDSGFLQKDYGLLKQETTPDGGTRRVYVSSAFTPANYNAVWLDQVAYYPEPQPTENVSMENLTQIRNAIDQSLRHKIGRQVRLVDRASPGVAHVRIAITAIGAEKEALKAYQYIPIALVLTGAKAALEGGMPRDASIAIETRVTDSMSGELLYAAVRGGTGERIAKATQDQGGVQLSNLQALIDQWSTGAAAEVRTYVAGG